VRATSIVTSESYATGRRPTNSRPSPDLPPRTTDPAPGRLSSFSIYGPVTPRSSTRQAARPRLQWPLPATRPGANTGGPTAAGPPEPGSCAVEAWPGDSSSCVGALSVPLAHGPSVFPRAAVSVAPSGLVPRGAQAVSSPESRRVPRQSAPCAQLPPPGGRFGPRDQRLASKSGTQGGQEPAIPRPCRRLPRVAGLQPPSAPVQSCAGAHARA
jgi:hypothetical protein